MMLNFSFYFWNIQQIELHCPTDVANREFALNLSSLALTLLVVLAFISPHSCCFGFFATRTLKHWNDHNSLLSPCCSGIVISVPHAVSHAYNSRGKNEFCEVSCIIVCSSVMCIMMCNVILESHNQNLNPRCIRTSCFINTVGRQWSQSLLQWHTPLSKQGDGFCWVYFWPSATKWLRLSAQTVVLCSTRISAPLGKHGSKVLSRYCGRGRAMTELVLKISYRKNRISLISSVLFTFSVCFKLIPT